MISHLPIDNTPHHTRKPQRITITIPYGLWKRLQDKADTEGRSLSNLCCYVLESSLDYKRNTI
jgi:macrodomain Ter protein organizer (MatP/YcbG family)